MTSVYTMKELNRYKYISLASVHTGHSLTLINERSRSRYYFNRSDYLVSVFEVTSLQRGHRTRLQDDQTHKTQWYTL